MRTVEVIFVIIILLGAFVITTQFAVLPSSRQAFGTNLRELSQSTLETLDKQGMLSETVFADSSVAWGDLQKALSASLPSNIVYNLTVYDLSTDAGGVVTYEALTSISDATNLGSGSDAASFLVTSPDVTYTRNPQKIGESTGQAITLYILNCGDANGWWITGYTGQSLATEFYDLLSPYFSSTVLVNTTEQLGSLLDNDLDEGTIQNAVVINTFGESVPIPSAYASLYSSDYTEYCYVLGQKVNTYNWTWVSIVGYPLYYVSNTEVFTLPGDQAWGIHGMKQVGQPGLNAFLQGLDNTSPYTGPDGTSRIAGFPVVYLSSDALELCNYYGIYPSPHQSSSRALNKNFLVDYYGLEATELFVRPNNNYIPAATYKHTDEGVGKGALTTIGLSRTPDPRIAALALLMYYHPTVYRSEFGASGTSRLVTLQLAQQGGT